jgi:hypothetical protein
MRIVSIDCFLEIDRKGKENWPRLSADELRPHSMRCCNVLGVAHTGSRVFLNALNPGRIFLVFPFFFFFFFFFVFFFFFFFFFLTHLWQ